MSAYRIWNDPISGNQLGVFRVVDEAWIPDDSQNSDYREYLAWVAEGNTAEEWTGE